MNVISRRVKQLRAGSRPLVESLEKLRNEDIALREVAEGKISYEIGQPEKSEAPTSRTLRSRGRHSAPERVAPSPKALDPDLVLSDAG